MGHIAETEVFTFDELSDHAKEKARDWYREGGFDYDWWDAIFDDSRTIGTILGFVIDDRRGGIAFSGFSSQGDGASFTGSWCAPKAPVKTMKAYAPADEKLHKLARDAWAIVQRMTKDERADSFAVYRSGREVHPGCMECEHVGVKELARDFAHWIYRSLEREWDYMNSNEQVDESILANEYTFTEEGRRFG